jgi:sugar lactone lactonase YvrE
MTFEEINEGKMFTKVQSHSIVSLVSIITIVFLISSCKKDEDPITPPADPPETQKHIDWPSLAKSPWPMYGGGPQFTFRSVYSGPDGGNIAWIDTIPGVNKTESMTSPVIGPDSTIYFISSFEMLPIYGPSALLYAVSADGIFKWKKRLAKDSTDSGWYSSVTTPVIISDGSIILATLKGYVMSFSPQGTVNWVYETNPKAIVSRSVIVDKSGDLYFVDQDAYLYSLTSKGQLNWKIKIDNGFSQGFAPAISPDGNTLYAPGAVDSKSLYALNIDGTLKWTFDAKNVLGSYPLIDNEGNIIVGTYSGIKDTVNSYVYSLKDDGSIRWKYKKQKDTFSGATMDNDGNLYFVDGTGTSRWLVSLNYYGELQWKYMFNNPVTSGVVCDKDGNIYVCTSDNMSMFIVTNSGTLKKEIKLSSLVWTTPVISNDRSVIITSVGTSSTFITKYK